jgi:tRNA threonylcarbamoyladenosine biosynthesis protein TsaB
MLVLALDTTTRGGSAAIARDGEVLQEVPGDGSLPPAAQLPTRLMVLLEGAGVSLPDIHAYAVATGPGSFTGLRVGIAAMQGLAFAGGKPLIGISGFDALAQIAVRSTAAAGWTHRIATWIDAWRGEVYAAQYEGCRLVEPPVVADPRDLLARAAGLRMVFIGDGAQAHAALIHDVLGDAARLSQPTVPLLAGEIARLATAEIRSGHLPQPHAVRPLYVRRADAELARDARQPP